MALADFNLGDVGSIFTSVREAFTGEKIKDPVEMAKLEIQMQQIEQAIAKGQIQVNTEEAKHSAIFVAGWRPFIGWVCGSALAFHYIVSPLILWLCLIAGIIIPQPPVLDIASLMTLLGGLLGLGGLRTFEKTKKIERNKL